jgi:hypothetical protein
MNLYDSLEEILKQAHISFKRDEFDFFIPAQSETGFSVWLIDDREPPMWQIILGSSGAGPNFFSDAAYVFDIVKFAL